MYRIDGKLQRIVAKPLQTSAAACGITDQLPSTAFVFLHLPTLHFIRQVAFQQTCKNTKSPELVPQHAVSLDH